MDILKWFSMLILMCMFYVTLSENSPLQMSVDFKENHVLRGKEKNRISCWSTSKQWYTLSMTFPVFNPEGMMKLMMYQNNNEVFGQMRGENGMSRSINVKDKDITIQRKTSKLTVSYPGNNPRYNNKIVTCTLWSNGVSYDQKRILTIPRNPSVHELSINHHEAYAIANESTYVMCELWYGYPSHFDQTLATLGLEDLGTAVYENKTEVNKNGYLSRTLIWPKSFKRSDNGKNLTCGFQKGPTKSIVVNVRYAPHSLKISHKYDVSPGDEILCSSIGNPKPNVKLSILGFNDKEEQQVLNRVSTSKLTVPATAKGNYTLLCTAINVVGLSNLTTSISVKGGPHSLKIFPKKKVYAGETISCSSEGYPKPNVELSLMSSVEKGKQVFQETAELIVPSTAEGNNTFLCKASNKFGEKNTTTFITVLQDSIGMFIDVPISLKPIISITCKPTRKTKWVKFDIRTKKESESFTITLNVDGNNKTGKTPSGLNSKSSGLFFTVSFPSKKQYNDCEVICSGEIEGSKRSVSKKIKLRESKLSRMYVEKETTYTTVVCEVNIGSLIENLNVTVLANDQLYLTKKGNESLVNFTSTIPMNVKKHEILCLMGNQRLNHSNVLWNYIDSTNVKSSSKPADSNTIFIIVGAGGGVVVILLAVSLIIKCRRRICKWENNSKTPEIILAGPVTSTGTNLMIEKPSQLKNTSEQRHGAENNSDDQQTSADNDTSIKLSTILPKLKFQVNINNSVTVVDDSQHHVTHGASAHGNPVVEELKMTGDVKKNAPNVVNNNLFVNQSPEKQVESESTEEDLIYADLDFSNTMVPQSSNTYYNGTAIKPKKPPKPSGGVKPPGGIFSGDYCVDKTEECPDDADIYSEIIGVIV